jgi:hypothetical protein
MVSRSILEIVLEEAAEVLGELEDWLRLAPYCPECLALPRCSHQAGCALGRVARLRCLLGSGEQQRRDEELASLRRERGCAAAPAGDGPLPAPLGAAVAPAHIASEVPAPLPLHVEPGAPTVVEVSAT